MGRSPCCEKAHTNKGAWTKEEDDRLVAHIQARARDAGVPTEGRRPPPLRQSWRLRWINYLRPDLKRGNFTQDEDDLIIKLHSLLGNKWSLIAGRLPGRTDNEIKNYWNTHIRRKLLSRGVDPATHRPVTDRVSSNTTTISFDKKGEEKSSSSEESPSSWYRVPDLNLELRISPPVQSQLEPVKSEAGGHSFFGLRTGVLDYRKGE
ncbi:uncharacterized protein A4U43_C01F12780 [Asparagus officinalis]|uniref:Uncharacterized protein n=1 Tax=Asparagus officinalis TaxID=4686 RepID=A0A5P1FRE8_ASPOF|nr:myb-related protein 308-like [Asparagus officinalis]ONK80007.1 uncharacterized protein A4U43_C01F12780 [Asparagus officinalis]